MGVKFRYTLIGFGPEVYFTAITGTIIFIAYIPVCIIIILSFGTPASMSFKITTLSVDAYPIFNNRYEILYCLWLKLIQLKLYSFGDKIIMNNNVIDIKIDSLGVKAA